MDALWGFIQTCFKSALSTTYLWHALISNFYLDTGGWMHKRGIKESRAAKPHLGPDEEDCSHWQRTWGHTAEGSLVGPSSIPHPRHAGQPTCGWWRRPASLHLWHGHPVGGREAHPWVWDPAVQRKRQWQRLSEMEKGEIQRWIESQVRAWDGSDNGDFFGDLFTLKVLLREKKNSHQDPTSVSNFSTQFNLRSNIHHSHQVLCIYYTSPNMHTAVTDAKITNKLGCPSAFV